MPSIKKLPKSTGSTSRTSSGTGTGTNTGTTPIVTTSPLLQTLLNHTVKASIVDLDHYRIRGGMAVETDYIILIKPNVAPKSESSNSILPWNVRKQHDPKLIGDFLLSKTYSSFRTLGHQLKKAADAVTSNTRQPLSKQVQKVAQYCETVVHLVESQKTQYLGKVNYNYVKALAKKRSHIIHEILDATLSYFPDEIDSHPFLRTVAETVETFFLLDHCEEVDDAASTYSTSSKSKSKAKRGRLSQTSESKPTVLNGPKLHIPFTEGSKSSDTHETSHKRRSSFTKLRNSLASPVVPYTRKKRRRPSLRVQDDDELNEMGTEANLLLDDDRTSAVLVPNYARPTPTFSSVSGSTVGTLVENNPIIFAIISIVAIAFLRYASKMEMRVDLDIEVLLLFASFCIGLHTPRPMIGGVDGPVPGVTQVGGATPMALRRASQRQSTRNDRNGRLLLVRSMASTPDMDDNKANKSNRHFSFSGAPEQESDDDEEEDDVLQSSRSPMPKFPKGAKMGSHLNCYSEPEATNFSVRGANYLKDRKKIPSGEFIFPIRGVDLFLTDLCPANAGSNGGVFGGNLRDKASFIINFRLPWGVLLTYFEIPDRFIPFVRAGYEAGYDASGLPSLETMSASDRCVARFLRAPDKEKDKVLKIVPIVVEGPWIVKSAVGGKPAILGTKLPVKYVYQKAEQGKALYLEADLDIVSSSAARGILSVARAYTQVLTLDLGFVVQGNSSTELPEQMLVGTRLHGIDPMSAPPFPPSKDVFIQNSDNTDSECAESI